MNHIKHAFFPTAEKGGTVKECQSNQIMNSVLWDQALLPEGSTVKGGRDGDDSVDGRQSGQEKDDQQHSHVEVVRTRGFEDPFLRHITAHHSPALQIHGHVESEDVQSWQTGGIESTHPGGENKGDQ